MAMEQVNLGYGKQFHLLWSPVARAWIFSQRMIKQMKENGIYVIVKDEVAEHFAVIDDELVWHGGMNLLGKEDAWDNLMRIKSAQVAAELLEIALEKE